jgi:hypothetical protein
VKVFLDHHPARCVSIPALAGQCGLPESQLKKAFLYQFNIRLEEYWTKLQRNNLSIVFPAGYTGLPGCRQRFPFFYVPGRRQSHRAGAGG